MCAAIRLYGTVTSPYVRRVRAAAAELGLECELVNVFTEDGQAQMRAVNPLWKVPTAEVDGEVIFDSRVIVERLIAQHGDPDTLAPLDPADVATRNVITAIDGALDALINVFYLGKDGSGAEQSSYVAKQIERARATMTWLDARVDDAWLNPARRFGLAELALTTTMGWMRFRGTYPIDDHPALMRCFVRHDQRPSLATTRPPEG